MNSGYTNIQKSITIAVMVLWYIFLGCPATFAQQRIFTAYFERDTIEIKSGFTFSNKLIIENRTTEDLVLSITMSMPALLGPPSTIVVGGNDKVCLVISFGRKLSRYALRILVV